MKYIWFGIVIIAMHMISGKGFEQEQLVSGELRLVLEEQSPEAILEKCAHVSNEPTLTPMGVINPFSECVKGNSEMSHYVSTEDQQKPVAPEDSSIVQEEIQPTKETFDPNSADPYASTEELREDEMKKFLQMIEDDNKQILN